MNKTAVIIVVLVVVLGLGAGVFVMTKKTKAPGVSDTTASTTQTTTVPNTSASTDSAAQQADNTISYSSNGFSPASLTVKSGSKVTIKNDSSRVLQFDSDPHPAHTDDTELNVGSISPGQSKTITVTNTGNHGYHNHLKEDDRGTLIVE